MKNKFLIMEQYHHLLDNVIEEFPEITKAYEVIFTNEDNIVDELVSVSRYVQIDPINHRAIVVDDFGILPFMITTKFENIICAQLADEHSALMTRDHNNSNVISIGAELVGVGVINSIINRFINHDYAGGRHQIRVDMLNSMGGSK